MKQLLAQIVTYIVFVCLMLFTFACLMTGEFPPKLQSVKTQYQALLELKNNVGPLLKAASERFKSPHSNAANINIEDLKGQLIRQSDVTQAVQQIQQEQARLKNQMDILTQQNNEILKLLQKNQRQ